SRVCRWPKRTGTSSGRRQARRPDRADLPPCALTSSRALTVRPILLPGRGTSVRRRSEALPPSKAGSAAYQPLVREIQLPGATLRVAEVGSGTEQPEQGRRT